MVDTNILLTKLEDWWREDIYSNHKENVKKLKKSNKFNINPFLHPYIANFVYGDTTPSSLAKALILPRIMGTSVTTTFGSKMQNFITTNIGHANGSAIPGVDIEFFDQTVAEDKRMYCQVKAGPNTINSDDVEPMVKKFTKLRNKARLDDLAVDIDAPIVGIIYGTRDELNSHYKRIEFDHGYGVFIGSEFWEKLTGDITFYDRMAAKLQELSMVINEEVYVKEIVDALASTDEIIALSGISAPEENEEG